MENFKADTNPAEEIPEKDSAEAAVPAESAEEKENLEDLPENAPEAEEGQSEDSPGELDKRGNRKKLKADKKQDAYKQKIEELEDRVKRQMAEFENFRKRTEKEKTQMFETGARSVIEKILPVVDNFERGLAAIPEGEKDSSFAEGMNMIYKQLMNELEGLDVKVIEAVGQEFDPGIHNAVMQVESDQYETGMIAQEMQKGYTYRDTVIRYSMVAVVS